MEGYIVIWLVCMSGTVVKGRAGISAGPFRFCGIRGQVFDGESFVCPYLQSGSGKMLTSLPVYLNAREAVVLQGFGRTAGRAYFRMLRTVPG